MSRNKQSIDVSWRPGEKAGHRLAEGLVLEVKDVSPDGHVRARIVNPGKTQLWKDTVLTFRTEYLIPIS